MDPEPQKINELRQACGGNKSEYMICRIITEIEQSRSVKTDNVNQSGFTADRRRDLYFATGNIYYSQNQIELAKIEFFKGFCAVGVNIASIFSSSQTPTVTPQQAFAIFQSLQGPQTEHSRSPAVAAVIQSLAKMYQDEGMNSLAISSYYLSISLFPTANTCNNLGILLAPIRLDESIQWYEMGLSIDPNHCHIVCLHIK
jgi:tetratricopeptide (TPR) repeat protein